MPKTEGFMKDPPIAVKIRIKSMIKYKLLDIEIFETKPKELYHNPKTKKAKRNDFLKPILSIIAPANIGNP